jgi:HlyD family secretion protein
VLILTGGLALLARGVLWYWEATSPPASRLRTVEVKRGDLLAAVTATGTIEPEEVVDVGAQVVGMIKEFGRDPTDSRRLIDFLSAVDENTVLARIDGAVYRARVDQATAAVGQARSQVEQARANLSRSQADVSQAKAKLAQAESDWRRAQRLGPSAAISQADIDAALANYDVGRANIAVTEATVDQNRALVTLAERGLAVAEANLREAQQNLEYTIIRSPVKGVIVDRRVNVGQTVVSSLNAPSLFLIAKDLKRLQVWASVNEADVGRLRPGQPVRFTVDAFPDDVFLGQVSQVRLNATMTQNVVTYTVVVDTDNSGGLLLPYLTANVQFEIGQRRNVLLVPNAALRWQPQPQQVAPDVRQEFLRAQEQRTTSGSALPRSEVKKARDRGVVWVEEKQFVRPVEVRLGLSDGLQTEVMGGELREGQRVVVGEEVPAEDGGTASPFTPRFFGGGQR